MDAPLITCPVCHAIDPDCLGCGGRGEVPATMRLCPNCGGETCQLCAGGLVTCGSVVACPGCTASDYAEPVYTERNCPCCDRAGWVRAEDVEEIEADLADEAEDDRMARRGRHVSGVRFSGPV